MLLIAIVAIVITIATITITITITITTTITITLLDLLSLQPLAARAQFVEIDQPVGQLAGFPPAQPYVRQTLNRAFDTQFAKLGYELVYVFARWLVPEEPPCGGRDHGVGLTGQWFGQCVESTLGAYVVGVGYAWIVNSTNSVGSRTGRGQHHWQDRVDRSARGTVLSPRWRSYFVPSDAHPEEHVQGGGTRRAALFVHRGSAELENVVAARASEDCYFDTPAEHVGVAFGA